MPFTDGNGKRSGEKCHEFNFGHVDFKKILRHSSGNVEEAIRCMNLELSRKTESREINL